MIIDQKLFFKLFVCIVAQYLFYKIVKSKNPKFIEISGAEMHNLNSINLKNPRKN